MAKWVTLLTLLVFAVIIGFLYFGVSNNHAQTLLHTSSSSKHEVTKVLHQYKDGFHRYTGDLKLPHSCYLLSQTSEFDKDDTQHVLLKITATDVSSTQQSCANIPTRYPLDIVVESSQELTPTLFVNNEEYPIVSENKDWSNPTGTIVNQNPL